MNMARRDAYHAEFEDFPSFLAAVMEAGINGPNSMADPRLEVSAAATGSGETIPSGGGFLVPTDFAADLWMKVYDTGQLLDRCERQPVTPGNALKIPAIDETSRAAGSRFGGVRTYWAAEGETVTATRPKFRQITLRPHKLMGINYATEELLADAPALAVWLQRVFALEASFEVEDQIVNGPGADRPLGLLNSGSLITVAKETGQLADTVLPENLQTMANRLWGPSYRTAIWLMSNDALAKIADGNFQNGGPVVTTDAAGRRRILAMPVELVEYTPALSSAGDVLLADLSQYLLAEIAPDFISSIHVRFLWNEGVFKFRWRVDGAPAWTSPITPKNSTTTQSPFVALAAR